MCVYGSFKSNSTEPNLKSFERKRVSLCLKILSSCVCTYHKKKYSCVGSVFHAPLCFKHSKDDAFEKASPQFFIFYFLCLAVFENFLCGISSHTLNSWLVLF